MRLLLARVSGLGDILQDSAAEGGADAAHSKQQPRAPHQAVCLGGQGAVLATENEQQQQPERA